MMKSQYLIYSKFASKASSTNITLSLVSIAHEIAKGNFCINIHIGHHKIFIMSTLRCVQVLGEFQFKSIAEWSDFVAAYG